MRHTDFIAELTQHIPPKYKHLIRYYGLYSSRTKGRAAQVRRYEKFGIRVNIADNTLNDKADYKEMLGNKSSKKAWAQLIRKIYKVDPFISFKCGSEMKVVAVIMDKDEISKIIKHLAGFFVPGAFFFLTFSS